MVSNQEKKRRAPRSGKRFQPPKLGKKRAVGSELKDVRREGILDAARFLLTDKGLEAVSMQEIADLSKVVKGTLYLYFKTKEELLIALLAREFRAWVADFKVWSGERSKVSGGGFSRWVATSLRERGALLILMAHSESILEKNVGLDVLVAFKRGLTEDLDTVARVLSASLHIDEDKLFRGLLLVHALIVGLYFKAFPGPAMRKALETEDLRRMKIEFEPTLDFLIQGLLKGL